MHMCVCANICVAVRECVCLGLRMCCKFVHVYVFVPVCMSLRISRLQVGMQMNMPRLAATTAIVPLHSSQRAIDVWFK